MSDYAMFYNSENGDRVYDADSFSNWLKKFFTTGVFEGDCQVTALGSMVVNFAPGYANIMGKVKELENQTFTLEPADGSYPRIDTIVIERNDTDRDITAKMVTGQLSGNTPAPTPRVWENGVYQLVVAEIYVAAGATEVTQANITDKRSDPDVCGIVAGTVTEMDFSQFTAQFEAYFAEFEASNLEEFDEWFQHMKDQLDTDAAGHLQNEIDGINTRLAGYTFHPSESINLVAYVADDSYYLDNDNKYVLANSETGQALITSDPTTYKALASDTDLYGIEGEDTVSGFEPSSTPITVGGQTLSTIDEKLNFLCENQQIVKETATTSGTYDSTKTIATVIVNSENNEYSSVCVANVSGNNENTIINQLGEYINIQKAQNNANVNITALKAGQYAVYKAQVYRGRTAGYVLQGTYALNANDTIVSFSSSSDWEKSYLIIAL